MRIALVCDDLVQYGGHEKIILDFCRLFPKAPLYTTLATTSWKDICKKNNIELITSFLDKFPFTSKLNKFYVPFLLHIFALESFNFDKYDLVISLSSRFAHGVITKPHTSHICYMSTVGRMFWESTDYFKYESSSVFKYLKSIAKGFLIFPLSYIRLWDRIASQRVDYFIANSKITQARIKKYYQRESKIIHPAVNIKEYLIETQNLENDYYLVISRLVSWKRIDLAIEACKNLKLKLKIIGEGPDEERLKRCAFGYGNISFLGYVTHEDKIKFINNCLALINTQQEDFGLVPIEAMACGKPVVAYKAGGVLETVIPKKTGEYFYEQTVDSLVNCLQHFNPSMFTKEECKKQAQNFDISVFNRKISEFIIELNIKETL